MIGRRFVQSEEYAATGQCSVEPFRKPDHRAKKHPRPVGLKKRPARTRVRFAFERCELGAGE